MDTRKVYASYGVLAHEKKPIFTIGGPASDIYDCWDLALPDGWKWAENEAGETLIISPNNEIWLPREILTRYGDHVCLAWYDGNSSHRILLD